MASDLRFVRRLDTSAPFDLRFGPEPTVIPTSTLNLAATIEEPKGDLRLQIVLPISLQSPPLPEPTGQIVFGYDNAVYRGISADVKQFWQSAIISNAKIITKIEPVEHLRPQLKSGFQQAVQIFNQTDLRIFNAIRMHQGVEQMWLLFKANNIALQSLYRQLFKQHENILTSHQISLSINNSGTVDWQERIHLPRPERASLWCTAQAIRFQQTNFFDKGSPFYLSRRTRWDDARKPLPGRHLPPTAPPPLSNNCYIPPGGLHVDLLFKDLLDVSTDLLFSACGKSRQP